MNSNEARQAISEHMVLALAVARHAARKGRAGACCADERHRGWRIAPGLGTASAVTAAMPALTASLEILATANLFRRGHRICVEIASADMPTGVAGATHAEYLPNHIVSSQMTLHKAYHDAKRPSHLRLPIIPQG
jgi:uncharacterized protein